MYKVITIKNYEFTRDIVVESQTAKQLNSDILFLTTQI